MHPRGGFLPEALSAGWDRYDKATNNGFPPGTCGGCGADDHFRNDCPNNTNKGTYPPRKAKGKGKWGKGKWGKGVGGVDDEEWAAEGEKAGENKHDAQQADEGCSVWDDDEECGWGFDDFDDVGVVTEADILSLQPRSRKKMMMKMMKNLRLPLDLPLCHVPGHVPCDHGLGLPGLGLGLGLGLVHVSAPLSPPSGSAHLF